MGSESRRCGLSVLFFPLMAHGHMLPMLDMARLFAARGAKVAVLSTPGNARLVQPFLDRANSESAPDHPPMQLLLVPFPPDPELPPGCENVSSIPPEQMATLFLKFIDAAKELRGPFGLLLRDLLPDCVVTDMFFPWTHDAAAELGIPRLVFHGMSLFTLCVKHSFHRHRPLESLPQVEQPAAAAAESLVVVPGLPHRIELLVSQIPYFERARLELADRIEESESKSYGVVVNSFYELEPDYTRHYREAVGRRAWHLGPLALCNRDSSADAAAAAADAVGRDGCLKWLDSRSAGSVVYVCFGSVAGFSTAQLREMAWGLEASGRPFVWVVRRSGDEWAPPEGFEERVGGRGLVMRGWAPQVPILNHRSVGAFVTHCGWNSCLEGVSAGLPLVTWPMFADQIYNEKLVVDVLKIGVPVGVAKKKATTTGEESDYELVDAAAIKEAVEQAMGGAEEARERRGRARELGEMARRAVEEGGSSYEDMSSLIQDLSAREQFAD